MTSEQAILAVFLYALWGGIVLADISAQQYWKRWVFYGLPFWFRSVNLSAEARSNLDIDHIISKVGEDDWDTLELHEVSTSELFVRILIISKRFESYASMFNLISPVTGRLRLDPATNSVRMVLSMAPTSIGFCLLAMVTYSWIASQSGDATSGVVSGALVSTAFLAGLTIFGVLRTHFLWEEISDSIQEG